MEEILRYIAANLEGDLSVDALAARFYMSRYYLMHRFKEITGYTVHQYRTEAAAAGRRADPGGRSGDEGGGAGGLSGVFHLPPGLSEHLPYQPEEFPISAPSVCVYRKRIIANKINAPPSGEGVNRRLNRKFRPGSPSGCTPQLPRGDSPRVSSFKSWSPAILPMAASWIS